MSFQKMEEEEGPDHEMEGGGGGTTEVHTYAS